MEADLFEHTPHLQYEILHVSCFTTREKTRIMSKLNSSKEFKYHMAKWETVSRPKDYGGLGL